MDADTKITVLKRIAARFNAAGITWALGASMLLYFKRIAPEFHDIDLMVADDDAERARQLLCEMGRSCRRASTTNTGRNASWNLSSTA